MDPDLLIKVESAGVVLCVIFSAFFSATETALTTLPESKISHLIEKHPHTSGILKKWLAKPGMILSTILFGNTLVNIVASILASNIAEHYLKSYAGATAVAVMTFILLTFGEITPKTFAKLNPEKFIVPALAFLRFFDFMLFPFSYFLSKFARVIVKMMGGKHSGGDINITQADIEYLIEKGNSLGVFEQEDQGELLTSVLEFKDTLVKEIMIPRTNAHFLDIETKLGEALESITSWGHSRIPVYEDSPDNIKGILYAKSIVSELKKGYLDLQGNISSLLRTPVLFVPETQKISETLKTMQAKRTHMGIVVDEFGGTSGLITLEDILEELVGEIMDEADKENNPVKKLKDGVLSVDAHFSIFDLEEELGIEMHDEGEDFSSLGGFIISKTGEVPKKGFLLEFKGYEFKVIDCDDRHIIRAEIKRSEKKEPENEEKDEN